MAQHLEFESLDHYVEAIIEAVTKTYECIESWIRLAILILVPAWQLTKIAYDALSPYLADAVDFIVQKQMNQPWEVWVLQGAIVSAAIGVYLLRRFLIRHNFLGRCWEFVDRVDKRFKMVQKEIANRSVLVAAALPHLLYAGVFGFAFYAFPRMMKFTSVLLPLVCVVIPAVRTFVATNTMLVKELGKCSMYWVVWACIMVSLDFSKLFAAFIPDFILYYSPSFDLVLFAFMVWLQGPLGGLSFVYSHAEHIIHSKISYLSSADRIVDKGLKVIKSFFPSLENSCNLIQKSWMSILALPFVISIYPISAISFAWLAFVVPSLKLINATTCKDAQAQVQWLAFFVVFSFSNILLTDFLNIWTWFPFGFGLQIQMLFIFYLQVFSASTKLYTFLENPIRSALVNLMKLSPNLAFKLPSLNSKTAKVPALAPKSQLRRSSQDKEEKHEIKEENKEELIKPELLPQIEEVSPIRSKEALDEETKDPIKLEPNQDEQESVPNANPKRYRKKKLSRSQKSSKDLDSAQAEAPAPSNRRPNRSRN